LLFCHAVKCCAKKKKNLMVTECYLQGDEITSDKDALCSPTMSRIENLANAGVDKKVLVMLKKRVKNRTRKGGNGLNWLRFIFRSIA